LSSIKRNLEILEVVKALGTATRMEIFHSFDGLMAWGQMKQRISMLSAEGLIVHQIGATPDKPRLISLTSDGEDVWKRFGFEEDETSEDEADETTEDMPRVQ